MRVSVRLFAGLRERAGADRIEVELPDGARVGDLLAAMASTPVGALEPGQCVVALNRVYARPDAVGTRALAQPGEQPDRHPHRQAILASRRR